MPNSELWVSVDDNDHQAWEFLVDSLSICAHDHLLSRKLLEWASERSGRMAAIAPGGASLDQLESYGHSPPRNDTVLPFEDSHRPDARLAAFVQEYLAANGTQVVVCENWGWQRKHIALQPWPPPRVICYGDREVLHVVTPDIIDSELVEAGVGARHYWQTGVCSACAEIPQAEIQNEAFFDEIVQNTRHIFIPAFDGEGSLIWSLDE